MTNRLYFVRVNKTASTSLVEWLAENRIPFKKHQFREGKKKLFLDIRNNSYNFFCVVRNPWDRAVSSWKFLFNHLTFRQFLEMDYSEMNAMQYNHSIPQYDFISDMQGGIEYLDFIGKFEHIEKTLEYISPQYKNLTSFPHKRKTNHKKYTLYYDDELKQLVAEKYAKDIAAFNYCFTADTNLEHSF